jgi:hypothetical protein
MRSSKLASQPNTTFHKETFEAYASPLKTQACKVLQRVFRHSVLPSVSRRRDDSDILRWVPWPVERGKGLSMIPRPRTWDLKWLFQRKQEPVVIVYESKANLADHEKIQGTEGNFSLPSH